MEVSQAWSPDDARLLVKCHMNRGFAAGLTWVLEVRSTSKTKARLILRKTIAQVSVGNRGGSLAITARKYPVEKVDIKDGHTSSAHSTPKHIRQCATITYCTTIVATHLSGPAATAMISTHSSSASTTLSTTPRRTPIRSHSRCRGSVCRVGIISGSRGLESAVGW